MLLQFLRDQAGDRRAMMIAIFTALIAFNLAQGCMIGLPVGSAMWFPAHRNVTPATERTAGDEFVIASAKDAGAEYRP